VSPRCFKNIKVESLPVTWEANRNAWMTSALFTKWLTQANRLMRKRRRNILLFVDNATSHSTENLSNITVKFLPANTTSVLQPLDQGIIRAFKARYRKHMLHFFLSRIERSESATQLCKSITVLDAVYWINNAWNETSQVSIVKCFRGSGFPANDPEIQSDDDFTDDDLVPLANLFPSICPTSSSTAEGFISFDSNVTTENVGPDWEKALVGYVCEYQQTIVHYMHYT